MKFISRLVIFVALAFCGVAHGQFGESKLVSAELHADTTAAVAGKPFTAGVLLKIEKGWHSYWQFGGDSGAPLKIEWQLPAGFKAGAIQWPLPVARPDEGDQLTYTYEDEVMLLVEITAPEKLPASAVELKAHVRWLACKETCIPGESDTALSLPVSGPAQAADAELFTLWRSRVPKTTPPPFQLRWEPAAGAIKIHLTGLPAEFKAEFFPLPPAEEVVPGHPKVSDPAADGSRTITVPYEGAAFNGTWQGVIATRKGDAPREAWLVSSGPATKAAAAAPVTAPAQSILPAAPPLLSILWGAFFGGLILNLMPCVLPVIALKIFGFVQQAGEAPQRVFRLGLAFVAGVFVFFLGLATLVVSFQKVGSGLTWGFQFQNAYLLTGLISLVFVFALSMFGVFEITIGSGTATTLDKLARKEGYAGAFTHGMFTTLLGTSCTAPLLGPVLGFAFVQPAPVVFLVFTVIAAGMSLPYFLLTWNPAWMSYLPKPGAWMERAKQFMGFILLGVVVWLLGVLGQSRGIDTAVAVCSFLLVVSVAAWIYGFARRAPALALVIALPVAGWLTFVNGKLAPQPVSTTALENPADGIQWQPFSPDRLDGLLQAGKPVFIDFTASWCLNCKYNERVVLETEPVRAALRKAGIVALKADWSNADPAITKLLKSFGRVGVPAYVLYAKDRPPQVLPEILTQTILLDALAKLPVG